MEKLLSTSSNPSALLLDRLGVDARNGLFLRKIWPTSHLL